MLEQKIRHSLTQVPRSQVRAMITDYDQETSASSVQGKDKATVAKKTKRATNAAKEQDEEKYDQKAEVAAQTLRAGEQHPNKPDPPLPNHDGLLKELNSHLEMFASSSKEEDVLSHTRDGSSDNEESNELSSEEESDYDHAREESPDEDSWEYVEWIP